MSDSKENGELDEEEQEEHTAAHLALHITLVEILEAALTKGLDPWCLMQELLGLAATIELDNDANRESLLNACGEAFDGIKSAREQLS